MNIDTRCGSSKQLKTSATGPLNFTFRLTFSVEIELFLGAAVVVVGVVVDAVVGLVLMKDDEVVVAVVDWIAWEPLAVGFRFLGPCSVWQVSNILSHEVEVHH